MSAVVSLTLSIDTGISDAYFASTGRLLPDSRENVIMRLFSIEHEGSRVPEVYKTHIVRPMRTYLESIQ